MMFVTCNTCGSTTCVSLGITLYCFPHREIRCKHYKHLPVQVYLRYKYVNSFSGYKRSSHIRGENSPMINVRDV